MHTTSFLWCSVQFVVSQYDVRRTTNIWIHGFRSYWSIINLISFTILQQQHHQCEKGELFPLWMFVSTLGLNSTRSTKEIPEMQWTEIINLIGFYMKGNLLTFFSKENWGHCESINLKDLFQFLYLCLHLSRWSVLGVIVQTLF